VWFTKERSKPVELKPRRGERLSQQIEAAAHKATPGERDESTR
jgi:hypothetical protein